MNEDKYSGRSAKLLSSLPELGQEEFQRACALWLLEDECWRGFNPFFPPHKPSAVVWFDSQSREKRAKIDPKYFVEDPEGIEIMTYIAKLKHSLYYNQGRLEILKRFKEYIKDDAAKRMYEAKIKQFENVLSACIRDVSGYLPAKVEHKEAGKEAEKNEVVQGIMETFGGEVI